MNWDDAKIFLALYREGTLRGAARRVGVDQATIGRRITAMEHALSATLFLRTSKGYLLTQIGEVVLASAERMELAATDFVRAVQGVDNRLVGEVNVATTDTLATDFLLPALGDLHLNHPDIRVILKTSTQVVNLTLREADIAIRTVKPANPDLIIRKLASWPIGLYASQDYLARHGLPKAGSGFSGHSLVVYEPHWQSSRFATVMEEPADGAKVAAGVDTSLMLRQALLMGLGLGEMAVPLAEQAGLVRVWPERQLSTTYEIWMVTHRDVQQAARVRAVIHAIETAFKVVF
ncbi:LysR family transcriptional regulator [Vibrio parahaemolyticus]|uniref:LysR family transcriptional regulator n=1 Tax=Vibrio parahaemolyticus TaxID=670 RepID=UPI00038E5730|nr:LysR family transcriptional regulator [Vibrio parahaemolyticus]EJG0922031.1 LysR family transcriptional regulator [Vibrio parahaemolyticus O1:K68]EJG0931577.1 LysR family transcriptional regulator [Vibrio parahaemolyticus O1]EJG0945858.1 LysR family transcriptional regulator [Vibrio parahaemolyticus O10]EQM49460.1 bacterial regulatory helix-turn-helix, lysR family protein [Vibrio parahaemolyticus VPCR-2010]RFD48265.1 LysR family transcriptional regulator [Vibrio parahaemolyticus 3355]